MSVLFKLDHQGLLHLLWSPSLSLLDHSLLSHKTDPLLRAEASPLALASTAVPMVSEEAREGEKEEREGEEGRAGEQRKGG